MADNSGCPICRSRFSLEPYKLQQNLQDADFRKHLEYDVCEVKPDVKLGERRGLMVFESTPKQRYGSDPFEGIKRRPAPLKPYRLEDDCYPLKEYLDQNHKTIQILSRSHHALLRHVKQMPEDIGKGDLWKGLGEKNYVTHLHTFLWIEEHYEQMRDVNMIIEAQDNDRLLYCIHIIGHLDDHPPMMEDNFVRIQRDNDVLYEGRVKTVGKWEDKIYVILNPAKFESQHGEIISIETPNRRSSQLSHRALDQLAKTPSLFRTLFPKKGQIQFKQEIQIELEFVNEKISNDAKQVQAIKCILGKTCSPAPYILIGPPGTGKTATLVEVIHQLCNGKLTSMFPRICILAQSNQAVDVIVKRLLDLDRLEEDRLELPSRLKENVIRVYAKAADRDEDLVDYSTNEVNFEELQRKRIIAMTMQTAGWLVDKGYGKDWFDYFFIDEASQATEANTLIPIAGFMRKKSFVVLAGDPKQLGPVVKSPLAKTLGLGKSLIERLLLPKKTSIYGSESNRNSLALTTLDNNYRSHPQIIDIPNKLFYNGQLTAKGKAEKIHMLSESDHDDSPIIFHGVTGVQKSSDQSPSPFNVNEIFVTGNYIENLLGKMWNGKKIVQDDIGIISPYRTQVEMIMKYLNHRNWNGIQAGTVESFQGREKLIMIISTVRSRKAGSEFLRDERRFNVSITRAIALLIVIGDPEVLYMESTERSPNHWRELIDICYEFDACRGTLPKKLRKNVQVESKNE